MTTTLTKSPADVAAALLVVIGVAADPEATSTPAAWSAFVGSEPSVPDECITVYDTAGDDQGRSMIDGEVFGNRGIAIRIRSRDYPSGWARADRIRTGLAKDVLNTQVTIGSTTFLIRAVVKIGHVIALGKELPSTKRWIFTINARVVLEQAQ